MNTRAFCWLVVFAFCCLASNDSLAQSPQQNTQQAYGPQKPQPQGPIRQAQAIPRQVAPGPVDPSSVQAPAGPPEGFHLTPAQQEKVDQLLTFWEQKTAGITTFQVTFGRWVFNPVFGPKNAAQTFTTGIIRYAKPDKGMIKEERVYQYDPALAEQGAKWPYKEKKDAVGEHWVCDGKSVFEFDHQNKKLTEVKLPPEMQGNAIAEGPLPFMFGAKAETIKHRYWVREIPRRDKQDPYQLEFAPKRRGEDFSRVSVKLDARFLPIEMVLVDLNRVGRSAYAFKDHQANAMTNKLANFTGSFVSPKLPRGGWTKVVHNVDGPAAGPRQAQGPVRPQR